ncbi:MULTISPECIES: cation diffusion facilitator family transporter [unclassified Oscillibacter]|uniref:cation diffusion facilitator family transporter n=1 Tax=unclassified Oscillibacter TaxID=2629304 RepID=UPI0025F3F1BB|nr:MULTISPECIES: cation diffusion facilitator family transporter [unclassified Oscillibacter]
MIRLLAKIFIKDRDGTDAPSVRTAYGVLCGAVGIFLNILLFTGKLFAGSVSGSIAVTADAFNNLSDAGSSVITLTGFRLGGHRPDSEHPFGHGRIEYISGLLVSMLIILMGFELARTSLEKILRPVPVEFSWQSVVILVASIFVKLYMYRYNRTVGERIGSTAMHAAAIDSLSDSTATAAVLLATLAGRFTDANIDGWCGILVALFIVWSGLSSARDTLDPLLGQPPSAEFVKNIRNIVTNHPGILGVHDLIVHDYGPGRCMISLHAEVPANEDVLVLHDEIDNIERELKRTLGCETVIHMDPIVTDDGVTKETRRRVEALVDCIDEEISIHDFRMVTGPTHTNLIFDAAVPFKFRLTDEEVRTKICAAVRALDGDYFAVVNVERSYTA